MNDCISRQAAIEGYCKADCGIEYEECGYKECFEIKFLKGLPSAQPEPQWIPCSERLPEHDGEPYLVTDYCEQINRKRMHIAYCYMNREGFWSDVPIGYKVIAWMPLPEPYQEDKA